MVLLMDHAKSEAKLGWFSGLAGRGQGCHGTGPQHFRCGFYWGTRRIPPQRRRRAPGAGYSKAVPAGGNMAAGAAPMPRAHFIGPGGPGRGVALAVGNHLFAVAATIISTTHLWHADRTRGRPQFLAVTQRYLGTHLHGHHPCYNVIYC